MDNDDFRIKSDIKYCFENQNNRISVGFEAGKYFIWGWQKETESRTLDGAFISFARELRKQNAQK